MNNNNIQKKLTSLTLMAIMVAGGMTFAVPGMVPEAYAANANLFVSAENSLFDNYMSGPQVIEVAIIDSSISDTNEGKGEPDVTVNGNQLRMVQATDGNWYGYFADYEMARAADDNTVDGAEDQGFNFGNYADVKSNNLGEIGTIEADGLFEFNTTLNVVREAKSINEYPEKDKREGQIGLQDNEWPFIQLYKLSAGGNVVVQYNKGGGAQSTTLTFDTVDDYAGIMLDRASYPQGAQVHATITDAWLNIDPTDEDSWTFATNEDEGTATYYHVYNDNGEIGKNTSLDKTDGTGLQSVSIGDLMCSDCALKLNPNVQGDDKHVITIQDNADSIIVNDNATARTAEAQVESGQTIAVLDEGTQPVTITEQGPNSGIFGTYDEADISVLKIIDDAERGTSATIDYNDSPVTVLVTHAFATIDIQPASAVWNSGELIPVVLVDADVNKNSRADEDISLSDPNYKIIPSLRTGSPITLGSGADSDGQITVSYDGIEDNKTDVNAFSDRAILTPSAGDTVNTVLIDLGITAGELQDSLLNTNSTDANYGYNLLNYDIRSLVEKDAAGKDISPGNVHISLVYGTDGVAINDPQINLVCNAEGNDIELLGNADCDNAPSIDAINETATVGKVLSFNVNAKDRTNDIVKYTVSNDTVTMSNATITQTGQFSWTPAEGDIGEHTFTVTVTDSTNQSDTATVKVTVKELQPNNAPVLTAIGNKTHTAGTALTFTISASDADSDSLTYTVSGNPAGSSLTGTTFTWNTPVEDTTNNVVFTVSDGTDSVTETITITVTAAPPTPIAIPLLYNSGSAYESQHFGTAFDKAVSDYNAASSKVFSSQKLNLGTTAVQSVLDTGAKGAVGTYTSEQLRILNDTDKIGTDDGDIVLLSYSSAAKSFANPDDGIFRLTVDSSRQVDKIVTTLIPSNFDNIISIHLDDAWSNDYVDALEEEYGDNHRTIPYNTKVSDISVQFDSVLNAISTGLSGLDAQTAIVILEFDHDRLDALIEELAKKNGNSYAYAGIETTKFIIPDVPSGAFGSTVDSDAIALLQATDMKTIKFALSDNEQGQDTLRNALNQSSFNEVDLDSFGDIFDRHAYAAYDAGQILTRAINDLGSEYTSEELSQRIQRQATLYSDDALIYNTKLNADGDLACMVYDIFEIDDNAQTEFVLLPPTRETTNADNCPTDPTARAPEEPSALHATRGDGQVTLMWTAPTSGTAPTGYKVQQSTDAGTTWTDSTPATATGTTVTVTGLTNDTPYHFRVFATNSVGDSATASNVVTATPAVDPNALNVAPVIDSFTPPTATVGKELTFTIVATDENPADSDAITFVLATPQDVTSNPTISNTGVFTWTPIAADVGQKAFAVTAMDDDGATSPIVPFTITVIEAQTAPGAPTGLTATQGDGQVSLSWTAPSTADATDYKVQYKLATATSWTNSTTITGTTHTVTGLTNDQAYNFRVIAINSAGDSPVSNEDTATPQAVVNNPPEIGSVTPSTTTATVGDTVTITVTATDAEGDAISVSSSDGATTDTSSPYTITWTPVAGDVGSKVITITAGTSDGQRDMETVTIMVNAAANNPPEIGSVTPSTTTATVGDTVTITVTATDAEGDAISVSSSDGATTDTSSPYTITWTPVAGDVGSKVITITAGTSDGQRDMETVTIMVNAAQVPIPDRVNFDAGDVNIPMLYLDIADNYEQQFFEAFGIAIGDYHNEDRRQQNTTFYDVRYNITAGTTADIDPIVAAEHIGVVGTYSSEQLTKYKDDSRIVFLSYASTASTLTENTDNIFRLTMDNKRQTAEVLKPQLDDDNIVNVITIHRNDAWSADFKNQLDTLYGNNHKVIAYDSSLTGQALKGDIVSKLTTTTVGTITANTAIVILGFGEVETVIMQLSDTHSNGTYIHTGIDTTKIFIPDLAATVPSTLDAEGLALLKATDMKTIKFALDSANAKELHDIANQGNEYADRHVYAAYDAGRIMATAIDQLGKEGTVEQLKQILPDVARTYNASSLTHSTILDENGDLECTIYDVLEIADDATSASFTYKAAEKAPAGTCTASTSSVPMLNSPQTVSCIDCAINSFGEIFGQTVQVDDTGKDHTHDTIGKIFEINKDMKVGLLLEYSNIDYITDSEDDPIVLDFFSFGFKNDGTTASDRIHNQIVRLELEETGDNTDTFVGGLEYVMLNQLNILDKSTYTDLSPISDEPTFIVMEDLTDEDSPRVNYFDKGADGVDTQIADQQAAPSHSGKVALDSKSYKVADTVIVTLTDADLNVDSDLIDIFTTVEPENGDMSDTVGEDVTFNGKSVEIGGSPLGRLLDITFDDETWTVNECGDDPNSDDGLQDTGFTLIETETASGVFTGSFQIPAMYCPTEINGENNDDGKRLSVTGTDIEVNYLDFRDSSGEIIEVGDSAGVRASTGSVALDRTVYPVPFANNTFGLHASAAGDRSLPQSDVTIHVRVSDPDYDVSASGEDKIAQDEAPIKVTVSRGQNNDKVVATAGAATANATANEYGPILEIAPDAGIFEADIPISYKDGPKDGCPEYPTPQNNMFKDGCVLQGDIITVQYTDPTDASGEPNSVTDSATFDLRNAVLTSDKSVYIIGSDMILTLIEPDFDLDNDGAETYPLDLIEWDSDAATTSMGEFGISDGAFDPEPNAFRETGENTGVFQVIIEIPAELDGDKLERGEEIELEYTDWGPSGSDHVGDEDEDINLTVFTSNFGSTVELDQKVYTWTDKVYITIVAPDHNFDSDLVDEIGNSEDDPIRIATRGADIDNYKLVETGTDTGIFTGEVILTGFAHDVDGDSKNDVTPVTSGNGPTNGFLATEDDDGLSVSFEFSEDETVVGSALIRWNIGEVQWLEASYAASGTGVVRVIDPDMNLNPESVDNFEINVWSDSDVGGIDLTVTETNQATGIFEGTAFFTVSDTSSGHRLRVSEGDTVTAEYNDRTLPDPHDTSDEIDITATTLIGSIIPPLERAPATNLRVVDAFSNTLDTITVDQQVQITADLANGQDKDQPFAYIVQIQDSSSVTVALAWLSGTLNPSQSISPALSWTPSEAGTYTATAFVWESVDNPTALSPPNELTITVN